MNIRIALLTLLTAIALQGLAQVPLGKRNSLSAQYSIGSAVVSQTKNLIGSQEINGHTHQVGLNYYRELPFGLGFSTGLVYGKQKLQRDASPGLSTGRQTFNSSFIHVPILGQYNFLEYLFVQLGPTLSIELDSSEEVNKSGLGLYGSFGAQLSQGNLRWTLSPFYHAQDLIAFSKNNKQSLQNVGLNIGMGFKF